MYISVWAGKNLSKPGNGHGRRHGGKRSGTGVHGSSAVVDESQIRTGMLNNGRATGTDLRTAIRKHLVLFDELSPYLFFNSTLDFFEFTER
jgi:hypothetical protein